MNPVRESIRHVVENSRHVAVNQEGIESFVRDFDKNKLNHWLSISPFGINSLTDTEKLNFVLVLDSISFSYWGCPKWEIDYHGKIYDGAQGMMAALGRAVESGKPILDTNYLAGMGRKGLEGILRGNIEIPLLDERQRILNEAGLALVGKYGGDCSKLLEKADVSAIRFVELLIEGFPSFKDSATYSGKEIYFNKRAQLLASDLHHAFEGKGYGRFYDIEELTALADYKLPQVLRRWNVLAYSPELKAKILGKADLIEGSSEEVEIRASTIHAVELIKEMLKKKIPDITAAKINDYLWLEGQKKLPGGEPYHRVRTTKY